MKYTITHRHRATWYSRKDEVYSQTTPTWSNFQSSTKIDHTTLITMFSED